MYGFRFSSCSKIVPHAFQAYPTCHYITHTIYCLGAWTVSNLSLVEEMKLVLRGTGKIDIYRLGIGDLKVPCWPTALIFWHMHNSSVVSSDLLSSPLCIVKPLFTMLWWVGGRFWCYVVHHPFITSHVSSWIHVLLKSKVLFLSNRLEFARVHTHTRFQFEEEEYSWTWKCI